MEEIPISAKENNRTDSTGSVHRQHWVLIRPDLQFLFDGPLVCYNGIPVPVQDELLREAVLPTGLGVRAGGQSQAGGQTN